MGRYVVFMLARGTCTYISVVGWLKVFKLVVFKDVPAVRGLRLCRMEQRHGEVRGGLRAAAVAAAVAGGVASGQGRSFAAPLASQRSGVPPSTVAGPGSAPCAAVAANLERAAPQQGGLGLQKASLAMGLGAALLARGSGRGQRRANEPGSRRVAAAAIATQAPSLAGAGLELNSVRGVLPNGLRYVIVKHDVPPGFAEAHLEFHVGSVDEEENQRGMAHFMEHVCFLGSEKRLSLVTAGKGATSNALTDFHHTVYHVNVQVDNLADGMDMLAEAGWKQVRDKLRRNRQTENEQINSTTMLAEVGSKQMKQASLRKHRMNR